jgi:hypothetical protein
MYGSADNAAVGQYRELIGGLKQAYEENKDSIPKTIGDLPSVSGETNGPTGTVPDGPESIRVSVAGREFTGDELMKLFALVGGWVPIGVIGGLTLLLLLFLLLMWRKRLHFLIWYAIPFLLTGGVFLALNRYKGNVATVVSDLSIDTNLIPMVTTLAIRMMNSFRTYGLILAGTAILCIVLYALFHNRPEDTVPPRDYNPPRFVNDAQ